MPIVDFAFRGSPFKVFALDRGTQDASWFTFEDEAGVRDRDWHVGPGDLVLDVGSGYGSYALTALAAGADFVYCWNPNVIENQMMSQSLVLNGWTDKVKVFEEGVYSRNGWLNDISQEMKDEPGPDLFKVRTLDSYNILTPDISKKVWLKLDVEGAEVEVLKGAEGFIRKNASVIHVLVENHEFKAPGISGLVREYLESLGLEHVATHGYHGVSHSTFRPK